MVAVPLFCSAGLAKESQREVTDDSSQKQCGFRVASPLSCCNRSTLKCASIASIWGIKPGSGLSPRRGNDPVLHFGMKVGMHRWDEREQNAAVLSSGVSQIVGNLCFRSAFTGENRPKGVPMPGNQGLAKTSERFMPKFWATPPVIRYMDIAKQGCIFV